MPHPNPGVPHAVSPGFAGPARSGFLPGASPVFSDRHFSYHGRSLAAVHTPPYRYVRGYQYRQFAVGGRIPAFLLMTDYFLTDYYLYNLAPPGPSLMWVRFGPDALLVNTYTGEVADTASGMFDDSPPRPDGYVPPAQGSGPDQPPVPSLPGDVPYPGPSGYPAPDSGAPN